MSDVGPPPTIDATVRIDDPAEISDSTYRNYDGPLNPRFIRWWIVTKAALRLSCSQWWFYVPVVLIVFRFAMSAFQMFIRSQVGSQFGAPQQNFIGEPEGQFYALQFWSVICGDTNSLLFMTVALVTGAAGIAADNRANALLIYLAKPIGRIDYLFGKWMATFITLLSATLIPTIGLYLFCIVSYRADGFLTSEPWLGPRLLLVVLVSAILHSSLIVGISAWSKSSRIVTGIYVSVYMLGNLIMPKVGSTVYTDKPELQNIIQHCSIRGLIIGIDQAILRVTVPAFGNIRQMVMPELVETPKLWPLLTIAVILSIGSVTAAWLKIRAVEIVRG